MKTVILSAAVAAVLLVGSYVGYKSMVTNEEFSDLELANIEALADIELENGGDYIVTFYSTSHWTCTKGGSLCCPV